MKSLSKYAAWSLIAQLGILATTAFSQEPPAPAAAQSARPHLQFAETNFNFGTVQPKDVLKHEFILTNTGNAVLQITAVQPGCGCTTAGEWDHEIPPGKTGRIPLQFNPANFKGPVTKVATVTCNDPAQATHMLHIQATIVHPLDVQPAFVSFIPIEGQATNETKVVRITNNLESAVSLEPPVSTNAVFRAELKTLRPGKEFELSVTCLSSVTNAHGMITIKTSSTNTPTLTINATVMPQPALSIYPKIIQLPAGPFAANYSYPQQIRSMGPDPIQLTEPSVNVKGITAAVREAVPGKGFTVVLSFAPDFKMTPGEKGELTVKTSHPRYPVLKTPIVQMPPVAPAASNVQATPADAK